MNIDVILTDFVVTRYNSALLCTVFFLEFYILVVKWIIAVIINRTEKICFLIKRYTIYVASFSIWIITLIEINAVSLL